MPGLHAPATASAFPDMQVEPTHKRASGDVDLELTNDVSLADNANLSPTAPPSETEIGNQAAEKPQKTW